LEDHEQGEWRAPITFVGEKLGAYLAISSTAEAACFLVLHEEADPARARESFLDADEEAGVFIRP
jgi:hypothetical protein